MRQPAQAAQQDQASQVLATPEVLLSRGKETLDETLRVQEAARLKARDMMAHQAAAWANEMETFRTALEVRKMRA
jgi:hypothetical protein